MENTKRLFKYVDIYNTFNGHKSSFITTPKNLNNQIENIFSQQKLVFIVDSVCLFSLKINKPALNIGNLSHNRIYNFESQHHHIRNIFKREKQKTPTH